MLFTVKAALKLTIVVLSTYIMKKAQPFIQLTVKQPTALS